MAAKKQANKKLYTLTEVSRRTGISVPTLQRYKKAHQARLPAYGEGRSQRYPEEALDVFRQLRRETDERRGRSPAKKARRQKKRRSSATLPTQRRDEPLLSLLQIGQMTGISYPTLLRYVRLHLDRLPHVGSGRKRRFHPQAVAVFQELREQSRRGRSAGRSSRPEQTASIEKRIERLETGQRRLATQLRELERLLKRPIKITLQR